MRISRAAVDRGLRRRCADLASGRFVVATDHTRRQHVGGRRLRDGRLRRRQGVLPAAAGRRQRPPGAARRRDPHAGPGAARRALHLVRRTLVRVQALPERHERPTSDTAGQDLHSLRADATARPRLLPSGLALSYYDIYTFGLTVMCYCARYDNTDNSEGPKARFHYAIWFEAGSKLVADRFEAKFHYAIWFEVGRRPASNQLRTSFEPASNQLRTS